jgi:hypothetical protein
MESSDASTAAGFSVRPQTISKNQAILRTSHKWLLNQIPIARCWDDDIANVKFFDSCALQGSIHCRNAFHMYALLHPMAFAGGRSSGHGMLRPGDSALCGAIGNRGRN